MELLTCEEMGRADALAVEMGESSTDLMARAGCGVAEAALAAFPEIRKWTVLCGGGNNGGDGFIAARHLADAGCDVRVHCLGDIANLTGDAAWAARQWDEDVSPFEEAICDGAGLIDAVFGAGLSRDLDGLAREALERCAGSAVSVVAVDVPSGIDGTTGQVRGFAPKADLTVTFFCKKPAHCLYPARGLMGPVEVIDIGIPASVLSEISPQAFEGLPELWRVSWIGPQNDAHKYKRGAVGVLSGGAARTGAARLSARGALRAGAGLVTVLSPGDAVAENAAQLTAIMVKQVDARTIGDAVREAKIGTVVAGPGLGTDGDASRLLERCRATILKRGGALVLDADALTIMARDREAWFMALPERTVLTPHDGEFRRLFEDVDPDGSRLERGRAAAAISGACIVLKGADTVVAMPDGRAAINTNAPPTLATAGSGDVLAGIIAGLLARGTETFAAASAAVFLHGQAANLFGPGLIAEDLPEMLPEALASLDLC
ncbi:NAD(P)H-hydrate dehydratase [Tepidamorphus sp. 3E244]|uniref:NAD(P)H-hydrate dehydratase n=1 Tax=Tepidamorphus sp. 3E244 TaxID=3385498 RepID=UPI0038FC5824